MYKYKANVLEVYDGDSITLSISVGFNIYLKEKCRLIGIDCPEIRTKNLQEKELGYKARDYLRDLLLDKTVEIETTKEGKFGRYLCNLYYEDININNELIRMGYARAYDGKHREGWFS